MIITQELKELVSKKNKDLENAKNLLNKEFIGLEKVIDDVIDNIRPFYIFPKSLKRPIILNLFGMTATGKSKLVERLVDILNLNSKYVRFDIGEYVNSSEFKLKYALMHDVCSRKDNNMVIVFDELQMGRTINEKGEEIDRSSLRPIWELVDSGKLTLTNQNDPNLTRYLKFLTELDFNLFLYKDLRCKSPQISSDVFNTMSNSNIYTLDSRDITKINIESLNTVYLKNIKENNSEAIEGQYLITNKLSDTYKSLVINTYNDIDGLTIIPYRFYKKICNINNKLINQFTYEAFVEYVVNLEDKEKIIDFLYSCLFGSLEPTNTYDLSKSLIICIANIDEAYSMTHVSNPDADADIFYENSLKISQAKIKEALSKRFRMEQIGRLGNNIVIYPSFSKNSYKLIIEKILNERVSYFKEEFSIDINFSENLKNIFYKESVFPSQGVRPLLTTATSLIDSYVSKIIADIISQNIDITNIDWDFDFSTNKHKLTLLSYNNETKLYLDYEVIIKIDNLRRSDGSEDQAYVAIHESGHALLCLIKHKLIPKLVVSKTASLSEGFCRVELPNFKTKEILYNMILVCLGGRAAEKFILKDDTMLSSGAYSDLATATETANQMIKLLGHGKNPFTIKHSNNPSLTFTGNELINNSEEEALEIIKKAELEVDEVISNNKELLLEMIDYLSVNSQLTDEVLKNMISKYDLEIKNKDSYYDIKNKIALFKETI